MNNHFQVEISKIIFLNSELIFLDGIFFKVLQNFPEKTPEPACIYRKCNPCDADAKIPAKEYLKTYNDMTERPIPWADPHALYIKYRTFFKLSFGSSETYDGLDESSERVLSKSAQFFCAGHILSVSQVWGKLDFFGNFQFRRYFLNKCITYIHMITYKSD